MVRFDISMNIYVSMILAVTVSGCITGMGPPPRVRAPRAVRLQLDVSGDDRAAFDKTIDWVLHENGLLHRVASAGDARVQVEADLRREVGMLAGTDLTIRVRVRGDGLDEAREWKRTGLTSGVPEAEDRLLADAAVWALERAAESALAPPPPPVATPTPATAEAAPIPEEAETPTPIPAPKKKKHRR
jgi:hypothetical protein